MGVQALEQVNVLTPYWTSFPALAISGVDWDDHDEAHKAVMRMFPRDLAGPSEQRRATSGILFRRDVLNGVPTILVQSSIPPELGRRGRGACRYRTKLGYWAKAPRWSSGWR